MNRAPRDGAALTSRTALTSRSSILCQSHVQNLYLNKRVELLIIRAKAIEKIAEKTVEWGDHQYASGTSRSYGPSTVAASTSNRTLVLLGILIFSVSWGDRGRRPFR